MDRCEPSPFLEQKGMLSVLVWEEQKGIIFKVLRCVKDLTFRKPDINVTINTQCLYFCFTQHFFIICKTVSVSRFPTHIYEKCKPMILAASLLVCPLLRLPGQINHTG